MIRRLEHTSGSWIEYRKNHPTYQWRNEQRTWGYGYAYDMEESINNQLMASGWKEIKNSIDPNDLQATCDHRKYDVGTDSCAICGKDWNTILWQGVPGRCCPSPLGNEPAQFSGEKWHQQDCKELASNIPKVDFSPLNDHRLEGSKKGLCTCGSTAVGSDRHSDWCDTK